MAFASTYPTVGFASALSYLTGTAAVCATATGATSTNACLLDSALGTGTKAGYNFGVGGPSGTVPNNTYTANADPILRGQTGQRSFFSDESGVIRYNAGGPATSADPTVVQ